MCTKADFKVGWLTDAICLCYCLERISDAWICLNDLLGYALSHKTWYYIEEMLNPYGIIAWRNGR